MQGSVALRVSRNPTNRKSTYSYLPPDIETYNCWWHCYTVFLVGRSFHKNVLETVIDYYRKLFHDLILVLVPLILGTMVQPVLAHGKAIPFVPWFVLFDVWWHLKERQGTRNQGFLNKTLHCTPNAVGYWSRKSLYFPRRVMKYGNGFFFLNMSEPHLMPAAARQSSHTEAMQASIVQ